VAFKAHFLFTSHATVLKNKPIVLVDNLRSPCLQEKTEKSFLDPNISQAIQVMVDIFTAEVAAKVSQKAFTDAKWNNVTYVRPKKQR
jgi:hypothetical protein